MVEAGIFRSGNPAELLDGIVVLKMSKSRRHSWATRNLRKMIEAVAPKNMYVDSQEPIHVPEMLPGRGNVPEPDVMLIEGEPNDYLEDHPPSSKVRLVVEVSASTLTNTDRTFKRMLYAHGRVAEYWILNLNDQQLEVFQQPTGDGAEADYAKTAVLKLTDTATLRFGNKSVSIAVKSLFPG